MKLLFLGRPQADFLQDALYHGLATTLGSENVLEPAPNPRYHGHRPQELGLWEFPMLFFDFPAPPAGSLDELLEAADAVVVTSLDNDVVREVLARRARPVVFVDGEDHLYVTGVAAHVAAYCKREVLLHAPGERVRMPALRLADRVRGDDPLRRRVAVSSVANRRIVPLPLGVIDIGLEPVSQKEWDIVFLGAWTAPARKRLADEVERLAARGYRVRVGVQSPGKRPDWQSYIDALTSARVGLSMRGGGFDTYRYWETPYAGAVLVAETPQIALPDNFVDGEDAFFAPVEQLVETAVAVLERDDLDEIAARGRARVLRHHTSVARAERLLGVVERVSHT